MDSLLLFLVSALTSTLAAVFGLGGGMLLIAVLPHFLSPLALIPMHGVTQLASNGSRAWLSRQSIHWPAVRPFMFGSVLGIVVFAQVLTWVSFEWLPVWIGGYILLSQFSRLFNRLMVRVESLFLLGALQTGLGVLVGATGPLTTTLLLKRGLKKDPLVATNGLLMCASHGFKVVLFALLGFQYSEHILAILCLVGGAFAGSWLGTQIRGYLSVESFYLAIKVILSLLALQLIFGTLWQHYG